MAEDCADDDDDKSALRDLRKRVVQRLKAHDTLVRVSFTIFLFLNFLFLLFFNLLKLNSLIFCFFFFFVSLFSKKQIYDFCVYFRDLNSVCLLSNCGRIFLSRSCLAPEKTEPKEGN